MTDETLRFECAKLARSMFGEYTEAQHVLLAADELYKWCRGLTATTTETRVA